MKRSKGKSAVFSVVLESNSVIELGVGCLSDGLSVLCFWDRVNKHVLYVIQPYFVLSVVLFLPYWLVKEVLVVFYFLYLKKNTKDFLHFLKS